MRRAAVAIGMVTTGCIMALLITVLWVDRALAEVQEKTSMICLTPRYRAQIEDGTLPSSQRDLLVAKSINFQKGSTTTLIWPLRGALILWTYTVFWPRTERDQIFSRTASRMIDCPRNDRMIREGHSNFQSRALSARDSSIALASHYADK